jgi:hypothetical protein
MFSFILMRLVPFENQIIKLEIFIVGRFFVKPALNGLLMSFKLDFCLGMIFFQVEQSIDASLDDGTFSSARLLGEL